MSGESRFDALGGITQREKDLFIKELYAKEPTKGCDVTVGCTQPAEWAFTAKGTFLHVACDYHKRMTVQEYQESQQAVDIKWVAI